MKILIVFSLLWICFLSAKNLGYTPIASRSGCCSHHGGVCGCSFGRAQCCDGTLSPSCGC